MSNEEIEKACAECSHCSSFGVRNSTRRCPSDCKNYRFFKANESEFDGSKNPSLVLVDPDIVIEEVEDGWN